MRDLSLAFRTQFDFRQSLLSTLWKVNLGFMALLIFLVFGTSGAGGIWYVMAGLNLFASIMTGVLLRRDRYEPAAWLFVGMSNVGLSLPVALILESSLPVGSFWHGIWIILPFFFPVFVWVSSLLLPWWSLLIWFALQFGGTVLLRFLFEYPDHPSAGGALLVTLFSMGIAWIVTPSLFKVIFAGWENFQRARERSEQLAQSRADLRQSLEAREVLNRQLEQINAELMRQTAQLRASMQVSQVVTTAEKLSELFARSVELLHQGFGLHATIFLVEPEDRLIVVGASTWPALDVGSRFPLDERTAVGRCAVRREFQVEREVILRPDLNAYYIDDVRLDIAFPMLSRGQLQGVLNLQSAQPMNLGEQDINLLTSIAGQIASGMANLRALDDTRRALDDLERLRQRYVSEAWDRLTPQMQAAGYRILGADIQPLSHRLEPEAQRVMQMAAPLVDSKTIAVPISYGGQVLGVLGIQDPEHEQSWSEDAVALVQSVAEQMGQSLENARLFQNAQERLAEVIALQQKLLRESWSSYMSTRRDVDFVFRQPGVPPLVALPPESAQVLARREPLVWVKPGNGDAETAYVAPIDRRGQVIGLLGLQEVGVQREWTEEELEIINAVTSQLASAIEVAQLFEEVQRRAVEIERVAEELREIDRFRADFLAIMSHELRTPLNSIIGFSRVLLKGIDGPINEMQQADIEAIYNNGQNLLRLINDILDQSKIDAGKMELILENNVDLIDLVNKELSTIEIQIRQKEKPVEVIRDYAPDMPTIRADGARIRQVMRNLLSNAEKFTEQGSITIHVCHEEDLVYVSVADTGIGMPEDKIDLVFEKFRQIDSSSTRAAEGTGLGMPISRTLVELHGGRIWVESKLGVGTTFTFYLPVQGPQAEVIPELADLVIDKTKRMILVIERNPEEVENYRRFMENVGYQVVGLYDPDQAIRWARYLNPMAILMDVEIGENERGWQLLDELKRTRHTRQTPVVVCSRTTEGARAINTGASAFLRKPVVAREMIELFKQLSRR